MQCYCKRIVIPVILITNPVEVLVVCIILLHVFYQFKYLFGVFCLCVFYSGRSSVVVCVCVRFWGTRNSVQVLFCCPKLTSRQKPASIFAILNDFNELLLIPLLLRPRGFAPSPAERILMPSVLLVDEQKLLCRAMPNALSHS